MTVMNKFTPPVKCINANCFEWSPGMEAINWPIAIQQIRGGFVFEPGHFIPMKFCPWCGHKLEVK